MSPSNVRQRLPTLSSVVEGVSVEGTEPSFQPGENFVSNAKSKKTLGRTPDGTVFVVPTTHDMVSQLLDPRQPKNLTDVAVLIILAAHILAAYRLPSDLKRPVFAVVFLFWRAAYNIGIGLLLRAQSNHQQLVCWAKRWKLFESPAKGSDTRPWLYLLLKRELEAKIPVDYDFEQVPIEYNTWLVFRRLVDLILTCDFTSYCLFAVVCGHCPEGEALAMTLARWMIGILLVGFNLWVKLDAHRVVKDYAWYWGDFFYLIDQQLTFDGVFELAPHPMYSIGYAGFYGTSMIMASYDVLFVSVLAHAAQFAFLVFVENPHIDKIYNPPPPRLRCEARRSRSCDGTQDRPSESPVPGINVRDTPAPVHGLFGVTNFDLCRTTDFALMIILGQLAVFAALAPSTTSYQMIFVIHAIWWRLWFSVGLGVILTKQSEEKMFTRHFVKYGASASEAWRQWTGLYHISTIMCHASFVAACYKMYALPENWGCGWAVLRHVVGASLIVLQMWSTTSIYESLGAFGWFYGDFFFENPGKLTYTSIYRFLNNPERVVGIAGAWGAALITWSKSIFVLALVSHLLTLSFISYVEKPHMQKVYGQNVRQEAGLTKFIKRTLPEPVKEWSMSVDKALDDTKQMFDELVEVARTKLAAGSSTIVRDTTALFNKYPARITITRILPNLAGYDPKHYKLAMEGTSLVAGREGASGKEGATARIPKDVKTMIFEYGAPIRVKWTAPANHSKRDWIGFYMVTDNRSRDVTEVSSSGRWIPTNASSWDAESNQGVVFSDQPVPKDEATDMELVRGEVVFEGDKLWWTQGTFEIRYHHDESHNVMSVSEPFEVRIGRFEDVSIPKGVSDPRAAIEAKLLPLVSNCLDRDPNIAPATAEESFGGLVEREGKYAKRVVYAIRHMFGVEFAPTVVPADGNVRNLAWRICNAKQVLAPYSMSPSQGQTTTVSDKFSESPQSCNNCLGVGISAQSRPNFVVLGRNGNPN